MTGRARTVLGAVVVLALFAALEVARADLIYLNNLTTGISGQVTEISDTSITVRFPRKAVEFLIFSPDPRRNNDLVQLREPSVELKGKVVGFTNDQVTIRLPREVIREVRIGLAPPVQAQGPQVEKPRVQETSPLEDKVKELDTKLSNLGRNMREQMRLEVEKEIKEQQAGEVEGKVLWMGKPLSGAQVKLVRLNHLGLADSFKRLVGSKPKDSALVIEEVTDGNGWYKFSNVPVGEYDIYWKARPGAFWIRRLDSEADITVQPKNKVTYKDIEANVPTVN